jgi:hypothetical protein
MTSTTNDKDVTAHGRPTYPRGVMALSDVITLIKDK